jgi:hypothetical protein
LEGLAARIDDLEVRTTSSVAIETLASLIMGIAEASSTFTGSRLSSDARESTALRMSSNQVIFTGLVREAHRRFVSGDREGAMNAFRCAAEWGVFHHPGRFGDLNLEEDLFLFGSSLVAERPSVSPAASTRSVIHVASTVSSMGGHTRNIAHWATFDDDRAHSLILTEQGDEAVPSFLIEAVSGRVRLLQEANPVERVLELHDLLNQSDAVVLHVHPFDVVAAAAIADSHRRPPVIFMDHNDYLFGVGASLADTVLGFRTAGSEFAIARRGVKPSRSVAVPLPINQFERKLDRPAAKRQLGFAPDTPVLTTMALRNKYRPVLGLGFGTLISEVLHRNPRPVLVTIGQSSSEEPWATLLRRWPDRVRVFPPTSDPTSLLSSADLYLDSIPISSQTSLLEAAAIGADVLVLREPGWELLVSSDVDLEFPTVDHRETWITSVLASIDDLEACARRGAHLARQVAEMHSPERWRTLIDGVYRSTVPREDGPPRSNMAGANDFDLTLTAYQEASTVNRDLVSLLAAYGLLPSDLA